MDCSVGEVLKAVSERAGMKGVSIWSSDIRLDCDHPFADYFEPEAIYVIKLGNDFPEGSLMSSSSDILEDFGIDLANAKWLMDAGAGPFDMEEFVTKVVKTEVAPTILLVEWKPGFVMGGFAAVPWPRYDDKYGSLAADPQKRSFIFSLEPRARRFDLVKADWALERWGDAGLRGFFFGSDLGVCDDGSCWSQSISYAGGRGDDSFPDDSGGVFFTRFELWGL
jgi:hypothetical protein